MRVVTLSPRVMVVTSCHGCHLVSWLSPRVMVVTSCHGCHLVSWLSPRVMVVTSCHGCHLVSWLSPRVKVVYVVTSMFQGGKTLVKPDDQLQLSEAVCYLFYLSTSSISKTKGFLLFINHMILSHGADI